MDCLRVLLAKGADVLMKRNDGLSALRLAIRNDFPAVVGELIRAGALAGELPRAGPAGVRSGPGAAAGGASGSIPGTTPTFEDPTLEKGRSKR